MRKSVTYAVLTTLALTAPMSAFGAQSGFQTVGLNATDFEVIPRSRRDVDGYWCAASDFARRTLGAGWQDRIYVVRGYGPSKATGRRTSVEFSIAPPAGVDVSPSTISLGFKPGQSQTVQGARVLCNRRPIDN